MQYRKAEKMAQRRRRGELTVRGLGALIIVHCLPWCLFHASFDKEPGGEYDDSLFVFAAFPILLYNNIV